MQHREIKDRIERSVFIWKIRDVTFCDGHLTSLVGKPTTGSLSHFPIGVDRNDAIGTESLDLSGYAFTRPQPMSRHEPLGTASQTSFGIALSP